MSRSVADVSTHACALPELQQCHHGSICLPRYETAGSRPTLWSVIWAHLCYAQTNDSVSSVDCLSYILAQWQRSYRQSIAPAAAH